MTKRLNVFGRLALSSLWHINLI